LFCVGVGMVFVENGVVRVVVDVRSMVVSVVVRKCML